MLTTTQQFACNVLVVLLVGSCDCTKDEVPDMDKKQAEGTPTVK